MIKLNASYSKKVPAEQEYSSKSFMACVEVELPTGASARELQDKIHDTFELVKQSVESEISGQTGQRSSGPEERPQGRQQRPRQRQPDGKASNKQISYLLDLAKSRGVMPRDLDADIRERYAYAETVYDLSRADCSFMIDHVQRQKAAA